MQGWVIGALAISFLKIRDSGLVHPPDAKAIADCMKAVARQTMDYYDVAMAKPQGAKQNNHLYWDAVEVGAIAISNNNGTMFDWAVAGYRNGAEQITPEGTLPLEMHRGQRALNYHLYAIAPLVYLAEFGADNAMDLFAENNSAISRLVDRSIARLLGSGYFDCEAGIHQDMPKGPLIAEEISWAKIYVHHFPDAHLGSALSSVVSFLHVSRRPASVLAVPRNDASEAGYPESLANQISGDPRVVVHCTLQEISSDNLSEGGSPLKPALCRRAC